MVSPRPTKFSFSGPGEQIFSEGARLSSFATESNVDSWMPELSRIKSVGVRNMHIESPSVRLLHSWLELWNPEKEELLDLICTDRIASSGWRGE